MSGLVVSSMDMAGSAECSTPEGACFLSLVVATVTGR